MSVQNAISVSASEIRIVYIFVIMQVSYTTVRAMNHKFMLQTINIFVIRFRRNYFAYFLFTINHYLNSSDENGRTRFLAVFIYIITELFWRRENLSYISSN